MIGNDFLAGSFLGNGLTCGTTTTPLYPGRASSHAGEQSSQSFTRCSFVFLFFYSANVQAGYICNGRICVIFGGCQRESHKH